MKKLIIALCLLTFGHVGYSQEIGSNFNHDADIIDFEYLEKAEVDWIRATPRILPYLSKSGDFSDDLAFQKLIEAGEKGFKIAFGFRWDFNSHSMNIPKPGSREETELFDTQRKIMELVGPYVTMFKLGNEPNLETKHEDMHPDATGVIPLVEFTKRQLEEVVLPFYQARPDLKLPDVYIGSFPRMFLEEERNLPAVRSLIEMANDDPRITGLAVHLHISNFEEVVSSFDFVRGIMPEKPIIIPEFSLHRLFLEKREEEIGINAAGRDFAGKYGRDPKLKIYQWCSIANSQRVSQEEWESLFNSRSWFPKNYLKTYYDYFQAYGVVLATYPLFQQSCPPVMTPDSPMWFVNPIFSQKSLKLTSNGSYSDNPLVFDDFVELVNRGKSSLTN